MDWEALVDEFRSLGGVAENVRLDTGALGRGIFAIDPAKPARLHASENLMFPLPCLELNGEHLRVKPDALPERESAFFNTYHEYFGWDAGGYAYEQQMQAQWNTLPGDVIIFLGRMGGLPKEQPRFALPSLDVCMYHFLSSRQFAYRGKSHLIPLLDLLNHQSAAPSFSYESGVGVGIAGRVDDELRVCYNIADAWALAMSYSFTDQTDSAYSMGITVNLYGTHQLSILRDPVATDVRGGIAYPKMSVSGNTIELMNVMLGSRDLPAMPRAAFRTTMQPWLSARQADEIFDSIQHFNRVKFIELLRILRAHRGPLIDMLHNAALNHLETLAFCIGASA